MPDPVSWMLIEQGWAVVDSDGHDLGRVDEVLGDESADIFNGLQVLTGTLGKPAYVPAERVGEIVEGRVQLRLTKEELGLRRRDGQAERRLRRLRDLAPSAAPAPSSCARRTPSRQTDERARLEVFALTVRSFASSDTFDLRARRLPRVDADRPVVGRRHDERPRAHLRRQRSP